MAKSLEARKAKEGSRRRPDTIFGRKPHVIRVGVQVTERVWIPNKGTRYKVTQSMTVTGYPAEEVTQVVMKALEKKFGRTTRVRLGNGKKKV